MAGIRLGGLGAGEIPSASKSAGKTKGPEEGEGCWRVWTRTILGQSR